MIKKDVIPLAEKQKEFSIVLNECFKGDLRAMAAFFGVTRENTYYWKTAGCPRSHRKTIRFAFPEVWKELAATSDPA